MLLENILKKEKKEFYKSKPKNYNEIIYKKIKELGFPTNYQFINFLDKSLINFKKPTLLKEILKQFSNTNNQDIYFVIPTLITEKNFNSLDVTNFLLDEEIYSYKLINCVLNKSDKKIQFESKDLKRIVNEIKNTKSQKISSILENQKNIDFVLDMKLDDDEITNITVNSHTTIEFNEKFINLYKNKFNNLHINRMLANFKLTPSLFKELVAGNDLIIKSNMLSNPNITEEILTEHFDDFYLSKIIPLSKKFVFEKTKYLSFEVIFSNLNIKECEEVMHQIIENEYKNKKETMNQNLYNMFLALKKIKKEEVTNEKMESYVRKYELKARQFLEINLYDVGSEKYNSLMYEIFFRNNMKFLLEVDKYDIVNDLEIDESYIKIFYSDFQKERKTFSQLIQNQSIPKDLINDCKDFTTKMSREDILYCLKYQIENKKELEIFLEQIKEQIINFNIKEIDIFYCLLCNFRYLKTTSNKIILQMLEQVKSSLKTMGSHTIKSENIYYILAKNELEMSNKVKNQTDFGLSL